MVVLKMTSPSSVVCCDVVWCTRYLTTKGMKGGTSPTSTILVQYLYTEYRTRTSIGDTVELTEYVLESSYNR